MFTPFIFVDVMLHRQPYHGDGNDYEADAHDLTFHGFTGSIRKMMEKILNTTQVMISIAQSAEVGRCSSAIPVVSRW